MRQGDPPLRYPAVSKEVFSMKKLVFHCFKKRVCFHLGYSILILRNVFDKSTRTRAHTVARTRNPKCILTYFLILSECLRRSNSVRAYIHTDFRCLLLGIVRIDQQNIFRVFEGNNEALLQTIAYSINITFIDL